MLLAYPASLQLLWPVVQQQHLSLLPPSRLAVRTLLAASLSAEKSARRFVAAVALLAPVAAVRSSKACNRRKTCAHMLCCAPHPGTCPAPTPQTALRLQRVLTTEPKVARLEQFGSKDAKNTWLRSMAMPAHSLTNRQLFSASSLLRHKPQTQLQMRKR